MYIIQFLPFRCAILDITRIGINNVMSPLHFQYILRHLYVQEKLINFNKLMIKYNYLMIKYNYVVIITSQELLDDDNLLKGKLTNQ